VNAQGLKGHDKRKRGFAADHLHCSGGSNPMSTFAVVFSDANLLSEAIDQLRKTQNIIIATGAIGDFEDYAVLIFKDAKDLYERVHQIKNLLGIEKVEASFTTPVIMSVPPITELFNFFNKDLR
jgi:hypothetical protein